MKRLAVVLAVLVLLAGAQALAERVRVDLLLTNATTTTSGAALMPATGRRTFHAFGATSAGAGSATIVIEVSNVEAPATNADWITAGTITLTLSTTRSSNGFATTAGWKYVRARVSAISGTGAAVNVNIGTEVAQ